MGATAGEQRIETSVYLLSEAFKPVKIICLRDNFLFCSRSYHYQIMRCSTSLPGVNAACVSTREHSSVWPLIPLFLPLCHLQAQ